MYPFSQQNNPYHHRYHRDSYRNHILPVRAALPVCIFPAVGQFGVQAEQDNVRCGDHQAQHPIIFIIYTCAQEFVYPDKQDGVEGERRGEKYREVEGDALCPFGKEAK